MSRRTRLLLIIGSGAVGAMIVVLTGLALAWSMMVVVLSGAGLLALAIVGAVNTRPDAPVPVPVVRFPAPRAVSVSGDVLQGALPTLSEHIFISYSHREDAEYVERLARYLAKRGLPVWYDKEIITGDRWAHVVRDQINSCAAFVVIMTPNAEQSAWVSREIDQAQLTKKTILPLLLEGVRFFSLADIQHADVTGGLMPSHTFIAQLRTLLTPMTQGTTGPSRRGEDG